MFRLHFPIISSYNLITNTMPKYAVAKGRKIGIYNTWAECQAQTAGFTGAMFRKFDTQEQAENYIKTNGVGVSPSKKSVSAPSISVSSVENLDGHNASLIARISPSNTVLNEFNNRLTAMESKLSNFIEHVTNAFNEIKQRLSVLEGKSSVNDQLLHLEFKDIGIAAEAKESKRLLRKRKAEDNGNNSTDDISSQSGDNVEKSSNKNVTDSLPKLKETKLSKCKIVDEVDGSYGFNHSIVNSRGFLINPFGAVVVYTDGACSNNGKANAKAGIGVWFNNGHPLNIAAPVKGRATNNNAEIQAATAAILQAASANVRNLHVFTDSKFLINCITSWIFKWKRNNWQTVEGKPVINKEELIELDNCISEHMESVVWTYVKGHSNDVGNTSADRLAREGAATYLVQ